MLILLLLVIVVLLSLSGVLMGAPYLPTLRKQIDLALDLTDLKKGQTLLELGCGDGRVLIAAAKRGIKVVGYELNPFLAGIAFVRCLKYHALVKVVWGSYWTKTWPKADAAFVFLIGHYMNKLDRKLKDYSHKPIRLVSFAFEIPGATPEAEESGLYLYIYE